MNKLTQTRTPTSTQQRAGATDLGQQRGATLIVALVMLVALAMLAVWAVNASTANMRIVGNTQARQEAMSAAQAALEQTISTPMFISNPTAVAAALIPIDLDGNGVADLNAQLTPQPSCYRVRTVKNTELDPALNTDAMCFRPGSAAHTSIEIDGAAPTAQDDSYCAYSEWNVRALVVDARSNTRVAANQGVAVRSMITDTTNACP